MIMILISAQAYEIPKLTMLTTKPYKRPSQTKRNTSKNNISILLDNIIKLSNGPNELSQCICC
ncbi:hypothetical protein KFK09_000890 [Dendrobium nobile]|uniref:Uncharacterized protein n=1 Tax=Dendrobium nobile TaxID=94219 RepID=A0A8T3CEC7_DENNO|nr:hypothetical protein KFK09_000890 [Dendrobium nobile]